MASASAVMVGTRMSGWCGVMPKGRLRRSMKAVRMPADFAAIQARVDAGEPRSIVERELLGTDHGEIAGYLLGLWGLPDSIVDAVAAHTRFRADEAGELDELDVNSALGVASVLAREWRKVKAAGHAAEVLEAAKAL